MANESMWKYWGDGCSEARRTAIFESFSNNRELKILYIWEQQKDRQEINRKVVGLIAAPIRLNSLGHHTSLYLLPYETCSS